MILALLVGCTEPPVLDPVTAELAARAVAEGEPALRLFVATAGVLAETCGLDAIEGHGFTGGAAQALGATTAVFDEGDPTRFRFENVGLDGAGDGTLVYAADDDAYAVTYSGGVAMTATLDRVYCDDPGDGSLLSVIGGSAEYASADATASLALRGDAPRAGLGWSPPDAAVPTVGWARWEGDGEETITLEDAAAVDAEAGTWPGTAADTGWSRAVEVALP